MIVFEFNYQCVTAEHIVHIQFHASNVPSKPYNKRITVMLLFTDWPSKLWHPAAMTRVLTHFSHSLFLILHGPYTIWTLFLQQISLLNWPIFSNPHWLLKKETFHHGLNWKLILFVKKGKHPLMYIFWNLYLLSCWGSSPTRMSKIILKMLLCWFWLSLEAFYLPCPWV